MVSTLTGTPARPSWVRTGAPRRTSSSAGMRCAPGRVDSPPTSTMSAPCAASSSPWPMAASAPSHWPPSENESGVTLTTPMTRQRGWLGSPASRGRGAGSGLIMPPTLWGRPGPFRGAPPPAPPQPAAQAAQAQLAGPAAGLQRRPDQERLGLQRGQRDARRVLGGRENKKPRLPDRIEFGVEFVQRLDLKPFGQKEKN